MSTMGLQHARAIAIPVLLLAVPLLAVLAPRPAVATLWNEAGDAGDLPATAQVPHGAGTLTAIAGSLLPGGDADLYLIQVVDPAAFAASTCGGITDTQLWLFARDGDGITFDADDPDCGVLSPITGAHVPAPGLYFLAVSAYDRDALDALGRAIWLDAPFDVERAPDGPGAPGPLAAWGGTAYEEGPYTIELAGVAWSPVAIGDLAAPRPVATRLEPNAPNPFGATTAIRYTLAEPAPVSLRVYDATGRLVRRLVTVAESAPAAAYLVHWDGRDESGRSVPAGTYFYRLEAGPHAESRAMVRVP
jgi:hypothetical protein